jgi:lipopolysaccharide export system permease protein
VPRETPWLEANQLFVVSEITYNQLSHGDGWQQFSSTGELVTAMQNRSLDFGADARVSLHARFVRPLLDISLLLMGLPIMLSRKNESVFVAAAKCIGLMGIFFVVQLACHGLGSNYLLRPDLAAWLPLIVFGPLALFTSQPLFE